MHSHRSMIGVGAYALKDASFLLRIPLAKLRRWAAGYWYSVNDDDRFSEAIVPGRSEDLDERVLSFDELMELAVIAFCRSEGVSMAVVREARGNAQVLFDQEFPFATQRLRTDGVGIFADLSSVEGIATDRLRLELSRSQTVLADFIEPFFRERVDFNDDGESMTFWPVGRSKPIRLDRRRSFGRPTIDGTGVPTFVLAQMRSGGETLERLAAWYQISEDQVVAAVEFEEHLRSAA